MYTAWVKRKSFFLPVNVVYYILFVVYTERETVDEGGGMIEITRLILARLATSFERGIYYGKYN